MVIYPQTQAKKQDYTLQTHYVTKTHKKIGVIALPTEIALQYFFRILDLSAEKIEWDEFPNNNYIWRDFVELDVKT